MLNKRSEVDIRVAQELKNNQDFIYQTNQALQMLKISIIDLSKHLESLINRQNEAIKKLEIAIENQNVFIESKVKAQERLIDAYGKATTDFADESTRIIKGMNKEFLKLDAMSTFVEGSLSNQQATNMCLESMKNKLNVYESNMKGHVYDVVCGLRQEFISMLPELDPLKKDLNMRMDMIYIDLAGFIRELATVKKKIDYGEKKFENIYTLIERLKAGKS